MKANARYAAETDRLIQSFLDSIEAGKYTTPEHHVESQRKAIFANINDARRNHTDVRMDLVSVIRFTLNRDAELQTKFLKLQAAKDAADAAAEQATQSNWPAFTA